MNQSLGQIIFWDHPEGQTNVNVTLEYNFNKLLKLLWKKKVIFKIYPLNEYSIL